MCIGPFRPPKPKAFAAPPAISPRQPTDTDLPGKKDVVDEDTKADVDYGSGGKKSESAAGKKGGTADLKIDLNTGGDNTGSSSGGANV